MQEERDSLILGNTKDVKYKAMHMINLICKCNYYNVMTEKAYLFCEDDNKLFENPNEINEELQCMGNKIFIATPAFLNNQLSVIENKTAHNQQSQIHI
jgi:hypothetical protein